MPWTIGNSTTVMKQEVTLPADLMTPSSPILKSPETLLHIRKTSPPEEADGGLSQTLTEAELGA